MNLIRKQTPFFPSLIDDFIYNDWNIKSPSHSSTMPAVNIKELDSQFEIELAVPGIQKEDFAIEVEEGILSISSTQEEEQVNEKGKFTKFLSICVCLNGILGKSGSFLSIVLHVKLLAYLTIYFLHVFNFLL